MTSTSAQIGVTEKRCLLVIAQIAASLQTKWPAQSNHLLPLFCHILLALSTSDTAGRPTNRLSVDRAPYRMGALRSSSPDGQLLGAVLLHSREVSFCPVAGKASRTGISRTCGITALTGHSGSPARSLYLIPHENQGKSLCIPRSSPLVPIIRVVRIVAIYCSLTRIRTMLVVQPVRPVVLVP